MGWEGVNIRSRYLLSCPPTGLQELVHVGHCWFCLWSLSKVPWGPNLFNSLAPLQYMGQFGVSHTTLGPRKCSRAILSPSPPPCSSQSTGCQPLLPCHATLYGTSASSLSPVYLGTLCHHVHSGFFPPCWALSRKGNMGSLWAEILHISGGFLPLSLLLCWAQVKDQEDQAKSLAPLSEAHSIYKPLASSSPESFLSYSGAWELLLLSMSSRGDWFIYVHVPSHSLKGPDFWMLKSKKRLCHFILLHASKMKYQSWVWGDK